VKVLMDKFLVPGAPFERSRSFLGHRSCVRQMR
jgi:hypothetical protein